MEEETSQTTTPETEEKKKPNYVVIGVIAVIALLIGWLLFRNSSSKTSTEGTSISGTVDFNGIKPRDQAEERAKLVLMQQEVGQSEFTETDADIPMEDGGEWIWKQAEEGVTYNLRLDLYVDDQFIKPSSMITTTAPSTNQVFTINVTANDLPNYVVEELAVSISGTLDLNGLIPEGSMVTIQEKLVDEPAFKDAVVGIPAVDGGKWSWDEALNGQEYQVMGIMFDSEGTVIGESNPLSVVAPASNEVITINSGVTSEEGQKATISGNVYLQGPVTQDSTVLILARLPEEIDYDDVQRVPAVNGEPFEWKGAVAGMSYYISSVLQVEGDNVSQGNEIFTKAPDSGLRLVIDTEVSLDTPPTPNLAECEGPDSAGGYNAKVLYPRVEDARAYYMTVGTAAGKDDVFKEAMKADLERDAESITYIKPEETQYAQYSYTFCTTCDVYDTSNWSPFSPTLGFACPQ